MSDLIAVPQLSSSGDYEKFLEDLYLDKYGFLASNLNSPELSSAKKNSFRLKPPLDKVLLQNPDSD